MDSFILYTEQKEVIDKLDNEQAGKLFKAIYQYVENGEMPELDPLLELVIIPFKQNLDRNKDKWEKTKQKRSEAGKRGSQKRWEDNKPKNEITKIANANFVKNEMAKIAVNVNDNVNINVNDNVTNNMLVNKDVEKLQEIIINTLGNTNLTVIEEAISYLDDLPIEVIEEALLRTARQQKRWAYAKSILNNWRNDGLNTLEKIQASDVEYKNKKPPLQMVKEKKQFQNYKQRDYSSMDLEKLYSN